MQINHYLKKKKKQEEEEKRGDWHCCVIMVG